MLKCSFCCVKIEPGSKKLRVFGDKALLTLLCRQLNLPLDINKLDSPFQGFPSCSSCHHIYQALNDLYLQCLEQRSHIRKLLDDFKSRIETPQQQQQQQTEDSEEASSLYRGDDAESNVKKLRSAIIEKYFGEFPRICGSPWTVTPEDNPPVKKSKDPPPKVKKLSVPLNPTKITPPKPLRLLKPAPPQTVQRGFVGSPPYTVVILNPVPVAPGAPQNQPIINVPSQNILTTSPCSSTAVPDPATKPNAPQSSINDVVVVLDEPATKFPDVEILSTPNSPNRSQTPDIDDCCILDENDSADLGNSSSRENQLPTKEVNARRKPVHQLHQMYSTRNPSSTLSTPTSSEQANDLPPVKTPTPVPNLVSKKSFSDFYLPPTKSNNKNKFRNWREIKTSSPTAAPPIIKVPPPVINAPPTIINTPPPMTNTPPPIINTPPTIININPKKKAKEVPMPIINLSRFRVQPKQISPNPRLVFLKDAQPPWVPIPRPIPIPVSYQDPAPPAKKRRIWPSLLNPAPTIEKSSQDTQDKEDSQPKDDSTNILPADPTPVIKTKRQRKSPVISSFSLLDIFEEFSEANSQSETILPKDTMQIEEIEFIETIECELCDQTTRFCNEESLIQHLELSHNKIYLCPIPRCKEKFSSDLLLEKHIELKGRFSVHGLHSKVEKEKPKDFKCDLCPTLIKADSNLNAVKHYLRHEIDAKEKPLQCSKCQKAFASDYLLKRHVKLHQKDKTLPLACDFCDTRFRKDDQQALELHKIRSCFHNLDAKPTEKKKMTCRVCEKDKGTSAKLRGHEYHSHPELRIHHCDICDQSFVLESFLQTHLKTHLTTESDLKCMHCYLNCSSVESLGKHLDSHTGMKKPAYKPPGYFNFKTGYRNSVYLNNNYTLSCNKCGRLYGLQRLLDQHEKKCTGVSRCDICDKTFGNPSTLLFHTTYTHGNHQNDYLCELCGKGFILPCRLKLHIKKTHEDKSTWDFVCYFCNKRFYNWFNLKGHMVTHTKECGYDCSTCNNRFMYQWQLRRHVKDCVKPL